MPIVADAAASADAKDVTPITSLAGDARCTAGCTGDAENAHETTETGGRQNDGTGDTDKGDLMAALATVINALPPAERAKLAAILAGDAATQGRPNGRRRKK
jgi:hypothetical protein